MKRRKTLIYRITKGKNVIYEGTMEEISKQTGYYSNSIYNWIRRNSPYVFSDVIGYEENIFSLYKADRHICTGTIEEIVEKTGLKKPTIYSYHTIGYAEKYDKKKASVLICLGRQKIYFKQEKEN